MKQEKLVFEHIPEMAATFGEPCSNCAKYDGFCDLGHRTKAVGIATGHIPEAIVRRVGGCSDHVFREGDWYGEEPLYRCSGDYGGSKTSILG